MGMAESGLSREAVHPVRIYVEPAFDGRNRLTTAFRLILAFPHLLLVGGPIALALSWSSGSEGGPAYDWGAGGGVLGAVGPFEGDGNRAGDGARPHRHGPAAAPAR